MCSELWVWPSSRILPIYTITMELDKLTLATVSGLRLWVFLSSFCQKWPCHPVTDCHWQLPVTFPLGLDASELVTSFIFANSLTFLSFVFCCFLFDCICFQMCFQHLKFSPDFNPYTCFGIWTEHNSPHNCCQSNAKRLQNKRLGIKYFSMFHLKCVRYNNYLVDNCEGIKWFLPGSAQQHI